MSGYGHHYSQGNGIFIDGWGDGPFTIRAGGKQFHFEDSDRFGPVPIDARTGDPTDACFFDEKSPFWNAWRRWKEQGRRTIEGKKKGWRFCVVDGDGRKDRG